MKQCVKAFVTAQHVSVPPYFIQLSMKDNILVIQIDVFIHSSELAKHAWVYTELGHFGFAGSVSC